MVSSCKVWRSIGLGMVAYFIGGLIFGYIEIVLNQEPEVCIADVFFVLTYICVGTGVVLALFSRKINLEAWQWLIILGIAGLGSFLAWLVFQQSQAVVQAATTEPDQTIEQVKFIPDLFYIVSVLLMLIIATMMLLAFWGGKVSPSWRMIAAAAFSLYIADMWFKYATNYLTNYKSGDTLEVFWVFSGVLFGMGAVRIIES